MSGVRGLSQSFGLLGAIALGQQEDMWLAHARPNLPSANFAYPQKTLKQAITEFFILCLLFVYKATP